MLDKELNRPRNRLGNRGNISASKKCSMQFLDDVIIRLDITRMATYITNVVGQVRDWSDHERQCCLQWRRSILIAPSMQNFTSGVVFTPTQAPLGCATQTNCRKLATMVESLKTLVPPSPWLSILLSFYWMSLNFSIGHLIMTIFYTVLLLSFKNAESRPRWFGRTWGCISSHSTSDVCVHADNNIMLVVEFVQFQCQVSGMFCFASSQFCRKTKSKKKKKNRNHNTVWTCANLIGLFLKIDHYN